MSGLNHAELIGNSSVWANKFDEKKIKVNMERLIKNVELNPLSLSFKER